MLFAVHISDGVLTWPWLSAGFMFAGILLWLAAWRLREEEIPRIAVLTAAFFISSLIHIRVGPTSIHLLLTGLVGIILGPRSALAIGVGLLLQVLLIQHGGYWTLGVNTCVMTLPALLSWCLFQVLHRLPSVREPVVRASFVGLGTFVLVLSAVYSVTLLVNTPLTQLDSDTVALANAGLLDPWVLGGATVTAMTVVVIERRLEHSPEFPLGFLIGEISVLLTVGLNCIVLIAGGETNWPVMPVLLVIAHLPFAVVEGMILGFVVGFLARVKPEMLGGPRSSSEPEALAKSEASFAYASGSDRDGNTSSNVTSH